MKASYLLSKEVLPYFRQRGGGSIVYISSISGFDPRGVSIKNDFKLGMYNIRPVKICYLIIGKFISNHTFVVMYYLVSQPKTRNFTCSVYVCPTIYTINSNYFPKQHYVVGVCDA